MLYSKEATSIAAQLELLKSRGLIINDENKAAHYLSNISYYRLRAYTFPFQNNQDVQHPFVQKISFDEIIDVYVFDRKMRLLLFDAIEKIEIAFRTKIIHHFAISEGSHWYEKQTLYKNTPRFIRDISKLMEEVDRSSETFIKHYKNKYTTPPNPACWMALEVASLGLLSKIFENLKPSPQKKAIITEFGLKSAFVLESWMHSLSHARNICAHHGRVWNRRFTTLPAMPEKTLYPYLNGAHIYPNKIYAVICSIGYILNIINPGHTFTAKLKTLIASSKNISLRDMGFIENWEEQPVWN